MVFSYNTKGICARKINIEIENDIIQNVNFDGGCEGNLKGISKLVKGMNINEVVDKLEGIDCRNRKFFAPSVQNRSATIL